MKLHVFILVLLIAAVLFSNGDAFGQYVWTKDVRNPVLSGVDGTWNKHVFNPSVLFNPDSARYEMWFNTSPGYQGHSANRPWRVGFAVSKDGANWVMYPSAVLSPDSGKWDNFSIEQPEVIRENGQYKMWYSSFKDLASPDYLGYATSPDGVHWTKYSGNPIFGPGTAAWEAGGPYGCTLMPVSGGYKMWYGGLDAAYTGGWIGYATSADGISWKRDTVNSPVLNAGASGQWDDKNVALPNVLRIGTAYYMWYLGNNISGTTEATGVATSPDGVTNWTRYAHNPVLRGSPGAWDQEYADVATVLLRGDTLHLWYDSYKVPDNLNPSKIGLATSRITSGWLAQTSGTTNDLYRISFTDGNTGTIAGASGTILRTTNAGTAWTSQGSGTVNNLFGVSFWDSMNGWIAGDNGTILHTTNGGASWSPQATGRTVALWDVFCTDVNTATAVGDLGTILHTTNGGAAWGPQTSGVNRKLEALFFINSNVGTAVGDTGMILRTTNGGATWNIQASGTSNDLLELSFSDANTGTIVGTSGTILRTTNSGVTWASQTSGTTGTIWDVGFTSIMEGTVVGQAGMILHTTDGGQTWKPQVSGTTNTLITVCFTNSFSGIAAGVAGTILRTTTGGYTGVKDNPPSLAVVPHDFTLQQNFPNPFNPSTTIRYGLPNRSHVTLTVFNTLGQRVAVLQNEDQEAGYHEVQFDGSGLSSGVYFYRIQAGEFIATKRFVLLK